VFERSLAFDAMPERLAVTLVAVTMVLEDVPAFARQRHRNLAGARHTHRLDQPLLAQWRKSLDRGSAPARTLHAIGRRCARRAESSRQAKEEFSETQPLTPWIAS
jgi:hypothetical protein